MDAILWIVRERGKGRTYRDAQTISRDTCSIPQHAPYASLRLPSGDDRLTV
jgi:hypothetical protein